MVMENLREGSVFKQIHNVLRYCWIQKLSEKRASNTQTNVILMRVKVSLGGLHARLLSMDKFRAGRAATNYSLATASLSLFMFILCSNHEILMSMTSLAIA